MKEFKNELLEYLLEHSVEIVDLTPIIQKYCGIDNTFDQNDDTLIRCRLSVNRILIELDKMDWIYLMPKHGLFTGHRLNHETMRREFLIDEPVQAGFKTLGEIE